MARTADQIVTEQLGALHLQLVIAQARAEAAEEKVAELMAQVGALSASKKDKPEDVPESEDVSKVSKVTKR